MLAIIYIIKPVRSHYIDENEKLSVSGELEYKLVFEKDTYYEQYFGMKVYKVDNEVLIAENILLVSICISVLIVFRKRD
jgi:hypothetical protein